MTAIKIRVLSRQPVGPFMNMNPGETAVHQMSGPADFTSLGIVKLSDPAYRTLLKTGEVNGIRVLEMDDGKGWQKFSPAQRAEAEAAASKAAEAEAKARAKEAERAKAAQEALEAEERERAEEEAKRLQAEADEAARLEAEEAKRATKAGKG